MKHLTDERDLLGACGHPGPWTVVGHICARGRGGSYTQIVRCGYEGCGRDYLVEVS